MKEAIRYLNNAKEILKKAPWEGHIYTDVKYVQEACGTAYLAVLKAIDEYLLNRGFIPKELPRSVDEYRKVLRKHMGIHNGKLFREFDSLYNTLHIAGYYRGLFDNTEIIKDALKASQQFIGKIGK